MSDYSRVHDFSVKDGLASGTPAKKIVGSEVDAEFDAIVTAITSKADTGETQAGLEAGTVLPFYQAAAPTDWTIVATPDDCVLTVDKDNGGTTAGTGDITSGITSSSESAHTHASGTLGGTITNDTTQVTAGGGPFVSDVGSLVDVDTGATAAGSAHSHTVSAKYAKCILASRDA